MNDRAAADLLTPIQTYDAFAMNSNEVVGLLSKRLATETKGVVKLNKSDLGRYATDASIYQSFPLAVFLPTCDHDVELAISIARELKVPIVPRGAGTSQCGQTVGAGLVIDFSSHLRSVLELDVQARTARVQPGMVLDGLNAQLKKHGLWFPVDVSTSAQATLGGMAGNNSCGSRSLAYGNMVHNVLGLDAWTSAGDLLHWGLLSQSSAQVQTYGHAIESMVNGLKPEIEAHWPKVLRRVAGYNVDIFHPQSVKPYHPEGWVNLAHLLVGSEGTLSLTQSITLALSELPTAKILGVVNFASFEQAMNAAQYIVNFGGTYLSAVELVDKTMIDLSLKNPEFEKTIRSALSPEINQGEPEAILLVEFAGHSKTDLLPSMKRLADIMVDHRLGGHVIEMMQDTEQKKLWDVRKAGLNIMMSLKGDGKPVSFIEDCAVPLEHLQEYTSSLSEVFKKHGTRGTWYAHASVGTLHVRPILDMRRDGAIKMRAIAQEASELVRRFKGAYSGEHGDGLCRGEWIKWQFGEQINEAFRSIKALIDPIELFCPKRIIDPPKMDEPSLLRYAPGYQVIPIKTALDWSEWDVQIDPLTQIASAPGEGGDPAQGFAKAVDMCNNNGHCRKFDAGTMCPSFRVTREEKHLTRGRANTLRLALSGQLGHDPWAGQEVKEAMDLCVGCKGCQRECPTGVDMAKMKIEFMYQYKKVHGYTLKDRVIAFLPDYAFVASQFAPLLNLRNAWPILARLAERVLGLSAQKKWPVWTRANFFKNNQDIYFSSLPKESSADVSMQTKKVILWVDTFNGFFENDTTKSALRLLNACGFDVQIAAQQKKKDHEHHLCCGRTYLSLGMVDRARQKMSELIDYLYPYAVQGIPVIGLEPSCLLSLRDEVLAMGLGEKALRVSQNAMLLEEFLFKQFEAGELNTLSRQLKTAKADFLVHGHCHQKAISTMENTLKLLDLIPQSKTRLVESSCCGMAGSFGYDAATIEVSAKMAQLTLIPSLLNEPNAIWVADGFSCRHQIENLTGRKPVHVCELLAMHLPTN